MGGGGGGEEHLFAQENGEHTISDATILFLRTIQPPCLPHLPEIDRFLYFRETSAANKRDSRMI